MVKFFEISEDSLLFIYNKLSPSELFTMSMVGISRLRAVSMNALFQDQSSEAIIYQKKRVLYWKFNDQLPSVDDATLLRALCYPRCDYQLSGLALLNRKQLSPMPVDEIIKRCGRINEQLQSSDVAVCRQGIRAFRKFVPLMTQEQIREAFNYFFILLNHSDYAVRSAAGKKFTLLIDYLLEDQVPLVLNLLLVNLESKNTVLYRNTLKSILLLGRSMSDEQLIDAFNRLVKNLHADFGTYEEEKEVLADLTKRMSTSQRTLVLDSLVEDSSNQRHLWLILPAIIPYLNKTKIDLFYTTAIEQIGNHTHLIEAFKMLSYLVKGLDNEQISSVLSIAIHYSRGGDVVFFAKDLFEALLPRLKTLEQKKQAINALLDDLEQAMILDVSYLRRALTGLAIVSRFMTAEQMIQAITLILNNRSFHTQIFLHEVEPIIKLFAQRVTGEQFMSVVRPFFQSIEEGSPANRAHYFFANWASCIRQSYQSLYLSPVLNHLHYSEDDATHCELLNALAHFSKHFTHKQAIATLTVLNQHLKNPGSKICEATCKVLDSLLSNLKLNELTRDELRPILDTVILLLEKDNLSEQSNLSFLISIVNHSPNVMSYLSEDETFIELLMFASQKVLYTAQRSELNVELLRLLNNLAVINQNMESQMLDILMLSSNQINSEDFRNLRKEIYSLFIPSHPQYAAHLVALINNPNSPVWIRKDNAHILSTVLIKGILDSELIKETNKPFINTLIQVINQEYQQPLTDEFDELKLTVSYCESLAPCHDYYSPDKLENPIGFER